MVSFSNFYKSSSLTKVPMAIWRGKRRVLSCSPYHCLLPLATARPWQGGLSDCPSCPPGCRRCLCPLSCAVTTPGGAASPRWGQVTAGTLLRWGHGGRCGSLPPAPSRALPLRCPCCPGSPMGISPHLHRRASSQPACDGDLACEISAVCYPHISF